MVRTGNEDAFSFLHGMESRQDELNEYAMVLLCDGMGGYEAGEVAAAMCLQSMRKFLLQQPIFSALAGGEPPGPAVFTIDTCKKNHGGRPQACQQRGVHGVAHAGQGQTRHGLHRGVRLH